MKTPRILIFETKSYSQKFVVELVNKLGGNPLATDDIGNFQAILSSGNFDILIIDFPRGGRVEDSISINLSSYYVIATTADEELSFDELKKKVSATDLLLKPISYAKFKQVIDAAISSRRLWVTIQFVRVSHANLFE